MIKKNMAIIFAFLFLLSGCSKDKEITYEYTNNGTDNGIQCTYYEVGVDIEEGKYKVEQTNNSYDQSTERVYVLTISSEKWNKCEDIDVTEGIMYGGVHNKNGNIELKKGEYLYITKTLGGTNGHIKLTKQK